MKLPLKSYLFDSFEEESFAAVVEEMMEEFSDHHNALRTDLMTHIIREFHGILLFHLVHHVLVEIREVAHDDLADILGHFHVLEGAHHSTFTVIHTFGVQGVIFTTQTELLGGERGPEDTAEDGEDVIGDVLIFRGEGDGEELLNDFLAQQEGDQLHARTFRLTHTTNQQAHSHLHKHGGTLDDGDKEIVGVVTHLKVGETGHEGLNQGSALAPPGLAIYGLTTHHSSYSEEGHPKGNGRYPKYRSA